MQTAQTNPHKFMPKGICLSLRRRKTFFSFNWNKLIQLLSWKTAWEACIFQSLITQLAWACPDHTRTQMSLAILSSSAAIYSDIHIGTFFTPPLIWSPNVSQYDSILFLNLITSIFLHSQSEYWSLVMWLENSLPYFRILKEFWSSVNMTKSSTQLGNQIYIYM